MGSFDIQIAGDRSSPVLVDADGVAAVSPLRAGPGAGAGQFWWRVAGVDPLGHRGAWSTARHFMLGPPQRVFAISKQASFADMQKVLADAAGTLRRWCSSPRGITVDPGGAEAFLDFANLNDVTIDGGGGAETSPSADL